MRALLAGTLLVFALAVAGCGGSSSPGTTSTPGTTTTSSGGNGEASKAPKQVLADAVNAADAASSLHLTGNVTSGARHFVLDISVAKGKGAQGTITLGGAKLQLIVVGNNGYINGSVATWTSLDGSKGPMIAHLLAGRWLKFSLQNAQFQGLIAFANPKALFDQLQSSADSTLKNDGATTYNGQSAVALNDGAKNGTLYVAATGTPYPIALVKTGTGGGAITFGDWNKSVSPTAPTNVLDYSQLGG